MLTEDFHGGFRVWVEGRFNFDVFDADSVVESSQDANEVGKTEVVVDDEALHLMELCQMGAIQRLIPEDTVDGEELSRFELVSLGQVVSKHLQVP